MMKVIILLRTNKKNYGRTTYLISELWHSAALVLYDHLDSFGIIKLFSAKHGWQPSGMTDEKAKGGKYAGNFWLELCFGLFLAMALSGVVIHQNGLFSLFLNDEAAAGVFEYINQNAPNWSSNYRTFGHGAVHGMFTGLFVALPYFSYKRDV